jgi:hypothetical protein
MGEEVGTMQFLEFKRGVMKKRESSKRGANKKIKTPM